MPIIYHETTKTFHLQNAHLSYVMQVLKNGQLGQLYFGKRVHDRVDFSYLVETSARAMAVCPFEDDMSFSMDHLKQEFPVYGNGDMRHPALDVLQPNGSRYSQFVYVGHRIEKGKPSMHPLPHVYVENEDEMTTLTIELEDTVMQARLELVYSLDEQRPAIMRSARLTNEGEKPLQIDRMMSFALDLPDANYTMLELTGAWSRERHLKERSLQHGIQAIGSLRGHSSHNFNPFIALKRPKTTEYLGEAYGFSLIYSGNFLAQVEVDTYDTSRVMMGIHPQNFSWELASQETFQTPEAVFVYADQGLNALSQTFHDLYRHRLARGYWRDRPRPLLVNNWEGTYFDFNEARILEMAKTAKELGLELFVLDDGWFGHRNDDTTSLGDWYPNLQKLPEGITGLAKKVTELGLGFGLWFEPEMISIDSDLYRAHPEWMLSTPHRHPSHGRHQYILDFSNPEVVKAIGDMMVKILSEAPISYVKWDMNRAMSEVYSLTTPSHEQGKVMHRYILGVYDLYDRLTTAFPKILFESCASGGARFDPGMLYYAPQAWTSDDTDAVERLKIQYGTSLVYPISSMGSHVSAVPNHQLSRVTSLPFRANVAYFGTFGYELDVTKLSDEEKAIIKEQIQWMKDHRALIQFGTFYRLSSPFESNVTCWMVVSEDKREALVGWYRVLNKVNAAYERIRLAGLDEDMLYHVSGLELDLYGDELMHIGLLTSDHTSGERKATDPTQNGDFVSRIYHLKACG